MTDAETLLWRHLRNHRLDGQQFRRQQPIGPYIADFVHFGARLIVEADGGQHLQSVHDHQRDAWLCSQGFNILRFWNDDILLRSDAVLEMIWQALRASPSPPAPLLHAPRVREGRGEQSRERVGRRKGDIARAPRNPQSPIPNPGSHPMSDILDLTCELIRRASVTPEDAGCQALLSERLGRAGFTIEYLRFGDVDNLWATHGDSGPVLVFLGHTDVVPSGPVEQWSSPPFEPTVRDGHLHGRGAADMKSGVAAMTLALEEFVRRHPDHQGTVALLLTSDEEGPSIDGVARVVEELRRRGQRIDWCLVGEPSSQDRLGDLIRVGRRGSLHGRLTVRGVQGHVAYPELALNPIHAAAPALAELVATRWDEGNADFPPTSLQISNIHAGTGAGNVIPGNLDVTFNFRYGTASTAAGLRQRLEDCLSRHALDFSVNWNLSGEAFLTREGPLRDAVSAAVESICAITPTPSTGGGTSDGRFIAPLGAEVVELGPRNASIHKIDECVSLQDLERLPGLYLEIAGRLLEVAPMA